MKRSLGAPLFCVSALAMVALHSGSAAAQTSGAITAEDVRARVGYLASDGLRGRDTGTPGADAAARYLAGEMERLGLRAAGDGGSYLQTVPLQRTFTRANVAYSLSEGVGGTLTQEEILPVSGLGGLPRAAVESGSGPLVNGGYMADPSVGAEELTIDQLRGAVVIVRLGVPAGVDPAGAQPRMPIATLFGPGTPAAAVLIVADAAQAGFWEYAAETYLKGAVGLSSGAPAGPVAPPFFLISEEAAARLVGGAENARRPAAGLGMVTFAAREERTPIDGWNVAAFVPGKHPTRSGEYVSLGAHYDHVGVGAPLNGDSIYNGADDNASGTSSLLEVAERLASLPVSERPDRSVLFVWVTGEEHGLLGSEHFTNQPTVPRQSIVANLNMDMVGRNHPDSLGSVGSRRIASELGTIVEAANARQTKPFILDYSMDAPNHPEMIYCRSDHYNYARFGIPIVFLSSGLHEDYHAPSDHPEKIDADKVARVSNLVFDIAMEIGNRAERLVVDRAVPPLGTPCS